ncbi:unnamed protein product [Closterium sp. NIES-54]
MAARTRTGCESFASSSPVRDYTRFTSASLTWSNCPLSAPASLTAATCQRSTRDPRLIIGKGYRLVVLGGYGRTDPLLNNHFYPNGLVVGILIWYQSEGLVFESQCVHFGHPSAGGCQRSAGDPRLIIGKGYRLVVLGGYGHIDLLLNKSFYPNELNLGRGMWKLNSQRVNTAWFKSIRKLTLEQVHYESMRFQFLKIITRQLHEFTLYEDGNVLREHPCVASTTTLAFTFPNARLLRFRFASAELHLTLTVPPSLETLSVVAKQLVLSCKSSAALALHHLSLYGKDQLVISSLRLASARVVYLDGPASNQEGFSWTEWLGTIAPTVETMAGCAFLGWMNRNISVQSRMRKWMRMTKCLMMLKMMMRMRMMMMMTMMVLVILVVTIMTGCFGQCMARNEPALAALQQDYPALALYCVVDRSFYWYRKGQPVINGPLEHVRRAKSGVWDEEEGEKRAKKVKEKMHSVNRMVWFVSNLHFCRLLCSVVTLENVL